MALYETGCDVGNKMFEGCQVGDAEHEVGDPYCMEAFEFACNFGGIAGNIMFGGVVLNESSIF